MTSVLKALHVTGMITLRREEPDPAGSKPQFLDIATLTVTQVRDLSEQLLSCALTAVDYKARRKDENIRRLESEIKSRQEQLAELRARP